MFADLKGSTALIEGLDPEEARAIIDPALQLMMDAVHRYEGYVAQVLGDGIFALFGAPIAHEDHPQRALYAALLMQEEMQRYGDTLRTKGYPPLLMRVGVNTCEVVVRSIRKDDLHTDYSPVGHSVHLAARMEQLAAPGSILVTEQTHTLTDGYFAFKTLGQPQIKGVEKPLNVYEVLGADPLRTRLQVSARAHLEQALALYDPRQRDFELIRGDADHGIMGSSAHANVLWMLGYPGQALRQSRTALTLAQETAHPFTTAAVWFRNMISHQFLYDAQTVQQRAKALFALSDEHGYVAFLIAGLIWRGWALAEQGQAEEGIQQIQQGIAAAQTCSKE